MTGTKTVEVRRHSLRDPPDRHLSVAGVALAAALQSEIGSFSLTVSSPSVRAVETANGLGHPPSVLDPLWEELGPSVSSELPWPTTFAAARLAVRPVGSSSRRAAKELWESVHLYLARIADGERILIVTHGGFAELLTAGSGIAERPEEADGPIRCLEGIRVEVESGRLVGLEILRLPDRLTRV